MNWQEYYAQPVKPNWHYILYESWNREWGAWLEESVGEQWVDYRFDDNAGYFFICFAREEDATAFKLKWK